MVNKPNLESIVTTFTDRCDSAITQLDNIRSAYEGGMGSSTPNLEVCRSASESLNSETYQRWESFLSDWFVAAATRDASNLRKRLEGGLESAAREAIEKKSKELNLEAPSFPSISWGLGNHPSLKVITTLLDANGKNVTFEDREHFQKRAKQQLASTYIKKALAIDDSDWLLLTLSRTLRNGTAHRSRGSLALLNYAQRKMIESENKEDAKLARPTNNISGNGIGVYLYGVVDKHKNKTIRAIYINRRIQEIAEKLV